MNIIILLVAFTAFYTACVEADCCIVVTALGERYTSNKQGKQLDLTFEKAFFCTEVFFFVIYWMKWI